MSSRATGVSPWFVLVMGGSLGKANDRVQQRGLRLARGFISAYQDGYTGIGGSGYTVIVGHMI